MFYPTTFCSICGARVLVGFDLCADCEESEKARIDEQELERHEAEEEDS